MQNNWIRVLAMTKIAQTASDPLLKWQNFGECNGYSHVIESYAGWIYLSKFFFIIIVEHCKNLLKYLELSQTEKKI